jgi:sec-independent protein translocase protein TatA
MVGSLGPLELTILLGLFFVLFGAQRLPEMANALGRSKGEFQKGLAETTQLGDAARTVTGPRSRWPHTRSSPDGSSQESRP